MIKPAFVLGIDGLPYTLAGKLIADGVMPNLGRLAQQGTLARMHTTVPDFSCVAWTSFATGVNPGKHGIYGFMDFDPRQGGTYLPDAQACRATPLWHAVGAAGGRSVILNLPQTYPALPLRGKMMSGFIAPEFDKSCYPPTFCQTLKSLGYRMDLDGQGGLRSPAHVREVLMPVFESRKTAIRHIIRNEYWDLGIAVITETDRLQHFYQHTLYDPAHPDHGWVLQFYRELDSFIGEVAGLLDGKADLYMVSDHGFDVVKHEVVLEKFLHDLGLAPRAATQCWSSPETAAQTRVFTLDPGRFYINRKSSRFPQGFVTEAEVPGILRTITEALWALRDPQTGAPIVSAVRTKEQGFWGDALDDAPDLVAATHSGYYFRSFRFPKEAPVLDVNWEANHVWNDAIVYTPYAIRPDYQPMIWDVLPSVLTGMGVALPEGLDGADLAPAASRLASAG